MSDENNEKRISKKEGNLILLSFLQNSPPSHLGS